MKIDMTYEKLETVINKAYNEELRMDDLISRQALMKEFSDFVRISNNSDFAPTPTWNDAVSLVGSMPSAERSLWFRIGEVCVDESKGFISAGRAVEKIRELLRGAEMGGEE